MINNKFIFFAHDKSFQEELKNKNIPFDSIVFVRDRKAIWNRGDYYGEDEFKDEKSKGFFRSYQALWNAVQSPKIGDWAVVYEENQWMVYICEKEGIWTRSGDLYTTSKPDLDGYITEDQLALYPRRSEIPTIVRNTIHVDQVLSPTSEYAVQNKAIYEALAKKANASDLSKKQDKTTFKTINGQSIVGEGDIQIEQNIINEYNAPSIDIDSQLSDTSENPVQNKVVKSAIDSKANLTDLASFATKAELNATRSDLDTQIAIVKAAIASIASGNDPEVVIQEPDLTGYARTDWVTSQLGNKQDVLLSGINLATINGRNLLLGGNITIDVDTDSINAQIEQIRNTVADIQSKYISWFGQQTDSVDPGTSGGGSGTTVSANYVTRAELANYITRQDVYDHTINFVTIDPFLSAESANPVQNKAVYKELDRKVAKSDMYQYALKSDLSDYATASTIARTYATKDELTSAISNIPTTPSSPADIDLSTYATKAELANKLDKVDFKTINSNSITGTGDIAVVTPSDINSYIGTYIERNDVLVDVDDYLSDGSENPVQNKIIKNALDTKANRSDLSEFTTLADVNAAITEQLHNIQQVTEHAKGYYDSIAELTTAIPTPEIGDWAIVKDDNLWIVYKYSTNGWSNSGAQYTADPVDLSNYVKLTEFVQKLNTKQDALVSGTNIATINGQSIIEGGNIQINTDFTPVNTRIGRLENRIADIEDTYISWYGDQTDSDDHSDTGAETGSTTSRMITLTEREYQALVDSGSVRENVYYFTYEGEPESSTWGFGGTFPITLTDNGEIGTFPITLS